jgi:uncharacterized damage-inducible protein DinB
MKEQLLSTLDNSRNYTLAVADAMPANGYTSKPVKDVWSFGELMNHIAYGIEWWEANFIKGKKTDWDPPVVKNDKETCTKNLAHAYDALKATMSLKKIDDDVLKGFHSTLDHITHHRGQATIHLRNQGIVPPEYTY